MSGSKTFFTILSGLIALAGLLAAGASQDYLQVFGLMLFLLGLGFAFDCIRRHFDEAEAARHR